MFTRFFEPLENRRLMTASLVNGLLRVTGSEIFDVIAISQDSTRVRVNETGRVSAFPAAAVKRIVVYGLGGNDTILGRPSLTKPMNVYGGPGDDILVGGPANDKLFGGEGDDTLDGGGGADLLSGEAGFDQAAYSTRTADLRIGLDDVANDGESGERDNVRSDVEAVRTGSGSDVITGSEADNLLDSGGGPDTVYGLGGNDRIMTSNDPANPFLDRAHGGDGNDWIRSKYSPLAAYGDAGNDTISGADRANTLRGGAGNDEISGSRGNDRLDGGDGDDVIHAWGGNDTIRGGAGNDWIEADEGNDLVWGEVEPEYLSSIGIDTRRPTGGVISTPANFGGMISPINLGNIFASGGNGSGPIVFKPIDPAIISKVNSDTIFGGEGNDAIHGGPGDDRIKGDAGDDRLYPDAGADEVLGGAGRDTLVSVGGGTDRLSGETDGDTFWKDPADSADADFGEIFFGGVHEVASFANGVSTELEAQRLPDPLSLDLNDHFTSRDDYQPAWKSFADQPLFGREGVRFDDVRQGGIGDRSLLTAMAAVAGRQPYRIQQSMIDLGDGTFAVRLIAADGAHRYYRMDGDLPVTSDGTPYYAGLGHDGALWAALVEKAFALHRGRAYSALDRVDLADAFAAFGLRAGEDVYTELTTRSDIWNNSIQTMFDVKRALERGNLVTARSTDGAIRGGAAVSSGRQYVVEAVNMGALKPVSMTLREIGGSAITINYAQIEQNLVSVDAWA